MAETVLCCLDGPGSQVLFQWPYPSCGSEMKLLVSHRVLLRHRQDGPSSLCCAHLGATIAMPLNESSWENQTALAIPALYGASTFGAVNMSTPCIHHPKPDKERVHGLRHSPWDQRQGIEFFAQWRDTSDVFEQRLHNEIEFAGILVHPGVAHCPSSSLLLCFAEAEPCGFPSPHWQRWQSKLIVTLLQWNLLSTFERTGL